MVRAARPSIDEDYGVLRGFAAAVLNWARRRPTDTTATLLAAATILTIAVNALFLQSGPHPAPIFANKPPVAPAAALPAPTAVPRPRANEVAVDPRPRSDAV